ATSSLSQLGHCGAPPPVASSAFVALFDDLIRPQQERRRDGEAEGLGGFEVDDELEFRRLLDGKVGGLCALEDLVHVDGSMSANLKGTEAVRHEPAGVYVCPLPVDTWKPMLYGDLREMFTVNAGDHIERDNDSANAIPFCLGYGLVDIKRSL